MCNLGDVGMNNTDIFIENAIKLLKSNEDKVYISVKYMRKHLNISGSLAGRIIRDLHKRGYVKHYTGKSWRINLRYLQSTAEMKKTIRYVIKYLRKNNSYYIKNNERTREKMDISQGALTNATLILVELGILKREGNSRRRYYVNKEMMKWLLI